ncbi:hypothetical protein BCR36DRAFT_348200 [Piromyces finnis]|uniref:HIT-type domain-containing protein n=1 Tax=Piromyces finnis TaxID=1754191 RepID=A0A1Y1VEH2_9FUNG|nr:hypothetical protein BCR36DRAFT_348200 [Piromyces finnis]|eukprot:ORX54198.1 hypothetical protein BCR36DRAFT_348200 [Piromyces finnis]
MSTAYNPIINSNNETQICQICLKQYKKYVCPRCNLQYCSKTCYQSKEHKCAEIFFKENFMNLLKGEKAPENSKNEIMRILRKIEEEDSYELDCEQESDSEDEIISRFSGLNLDNMNTEAIWNKLNNKEKEQFKKLLNSQKDLDSQLDEIIIPWKPWWEYKINENENVLIKEIEQKEIEQSIINIKYPILNNNIQKINNISNKPKIFLGFNIIDIIFTYAYITRYFNGEMFSFIKEASETIWELTTILDNNLQYNFNNIEEILESKTIYFQKKQIINNIEQNIMTIEDSIKIIHKRENILLAFSDLIELYKQYQLQVKEEKKRKKESKEKYNHLNTLIKKGFRTEKKLYYYLCYSNTEEILSDDLIKILVQSLELKNEEMKAIKMDISENKKKYDRIKEKNTINKRKKLIEELRN